METKIRCALNLHNYNNFQSQETEVLICKICGHMNLPTDPIPRSIVCEAEVSVNEERKLAGHMTRDGTINFDKTW